MPGNPPFEEHNLLHVRSEVGMARKGKLKSHDGSEVNAMAAKTSVKASLPSLHDKSYPSLGLCVPQAILEETAVLHICDRNIQCHVLLQRYALSATQAVCTIRGILALYSQNTPENISEGLNPNCFLGGTQAPLVSGAPHIAGNPPCEFLPTPVIKVMNTPRIVYNTTTVR